MSRAIELFEQVMLMPGYAPEFPLDFIVGPGDRSLTAAWLPGLGLPAEIGRPKDDWVLVPTYDIDQEDEEGQKAIDKTVAKIEGEAWRLLAAAAATNAPIEADTQENLVAAMRNAFHHVFRVPPEEIVLRTCERDGRIVGAFTNRGCLVVPVRSELILLHTPHTKPTGHIECGFAVLDTRAVLFGKLPGPLA